MLEKSTRPPLATAAFFLSLLFGALAADAGSKRGVSVEATGLAGVGGIFLGAGRHLTAEARKKKEEADKQPT